VLGGEQLQDLTRFGVTPDLMLGEEGLPVDGHVEHTLGTGGEGQRRDDVLVVDQQVTGRADGTG
jgi:hypothetical protein